MDSQKQAKKLIEGFIPYVDYVGDDLLSEKETMVKNAKECALITVDRIIEKLDDIEKTETGVIHDCCGQDDFKAIKEAIIKTPLSVCK